MSEDDVMLLDTGKEVYLFIHRYIDTYNDYIITGICMVWVKM